MTVSHTVQGGPGAGAARLRARHFNCRLGSMMGFLDRLLGKGGKGLGPDELSRRLGIKPEILGSVRIEYQRVSIPKRSGGSRALLVPSSPLKSLQRQILRRVLGRLKAHPAAKGFERGESILTHARLHAGKAVLVKMDIENFFGMTSEKRVRAYFEAIGWNREAAGLLSKFCCFEGALPQGAPTSPRLSNLVNRPLDLRLERLAKKLGAVYSRYADDLAFSLNGDAAKHVRQLVAGARGVVQDKAFGRYAVHTKKKLHIRRRHARQTVTGLVVNNEKPRLPREVRRRLRAVRHRLAKGEKATLTPVQLAGWESLERMIDGPRP